MVSPVLLSVIIAVVAIVVIFVAYAMTKRRIVPPNLVHIVQRGRTTTSYGSGKEGGNVYYEWPGWLPLLGVTVRTLPVSNFDLNLEGYNAYDKDRLPFIVDVKSFFRIEDTNIAASKVENFDELKEHLSGIVQGAVRSILAKSDLETIMSERSIYGKEFTDAVDENMKQWGVIPAKNIELMDVRDEANSNVIANIMAKKKSEIEKESRVVVAENNQKASQAEIEAQQIVEVRKAEAKQIVGTRTAESDKQVGIANERSRQEVQDEMKVTKTKEMAVLEVATVRKAEIEKQAIVVEADAKKQAQIVKSEGDFKASQNDAEAIKVKGYANADVVKASKEAEAKGIEVTGLAKAETEKAIQLASVTAQKELASAIGENQGYQQYLITIKQVEAQQAIGIEQAKNIGHADIKIIANADNIADGLNKAGTLLTSKTGQGLASVLEGLSQTEIGKSLAEKFIDKGKK